jgi:hypothetical protein
MGEILSNKIKFETTKEESAEEYASKKFGSTTRKLAIAVRGMSCQSCALDYW